MRATVFDQHFAENLSPDAGQHAWWTARYQFPLPVDQQLSEPTWLPRLAATDIRTALLYDPAARTPLPVKLFSTSKAVSLEDASGLDYQQDQPRFVRAAISRLKQMAESPAQSELFWIHAGGLLVDTVCSAYQELYSDEEFAPTVSTSVDDDDPEQAEFQKFWRRSRSSPRELADDKLLGTGWKSVKSANAQVDWQLRRDMYSGQVTQWDAWLGRIFEAIGELRKSAPVLLIFTAATGEHLGEHAGIPSSSDLFGEQIQVPLIVELPLHESLSGRRCDLTQHLDLPATILDWLSAANPAGDEFDGMSLLPVIRDDQPLSRDIIFVGNGSLAGIRTADLYVRQQLTAIDHNPQEMVFLKPDDCWDADNVLRQYVDSADDLTRKWHEFVAKIRERS